MKFIITGGAGFIGSHVVDTFLQQGHEVVIFDNFSSGRHENLAHVVSKISVVEGDIRDAQAFEDASQGCDGVVHLAALTSVTESVQLPEKCFDINAEGTFIVFDTARRLGITRIVFASSCAVYGDSQRPPVSEKGAISPQSPYAASKLMAEALAESFYHSYGMKIACLRFFNVYGPRQRADSDYAAVVPKFVECYLQKRSPKVFGDGLQTRDFIHVTDIARAICRAGTISEDALNQQRVFNVGTGNAVSLLDLLEIFPKITGFKLETQFCEGRKGEVRHSYADVSSAKEILGFEAKVSFEDGLRELLG